MIYIKKTYLSLLLIVITFIVYLELGNNKFIDQYDDFEYIIQNQHIQKPLNMQTLKWAFFSSHSSNWHPLTWLSHSLDYHFFGLNPGAHHFISLLLHIFNTILLFLLFYILTKSKTKSFLIALFFAIHPMHVESVAWASERKDVLSMFFFLLSLISYSKYSAKNNRKYYYITLVMIICSLMSKPMMVTAPLILLLFDFYPLKRFNHSGFLSHQNVYILIEKLPFFVLSIITGIITIYAQSADNAVVSLHKIPLFIRISNALLSYWLYIVKTIAPYNLSPYYPHPDYFPVWQTCIIFFFIALFSFYSLRMFKKHPFILWGWSWFIITLLPVIGIVQVGSQAMADRYAYISQLGLWIIIIWSFDLLKLPQKTKNIIAICIILVLSVFYIIQTKAQISHWYDSESLFRYALTQNSDNFAAHYILGMSLSDKDNYNEAIYHFKEAEKIIPNSTKLLNSMALAYNKSGMTKHAIAINKKALKISNNMKALNNIGSFYLNNNEPDSAKKYLLKAYETDSTIWQISRNLGELYLNGNEFLKAKNYLQLSIDLNSKNGKSYFLLAGTYLQIKDFGKAEISVKKCLQLRPGFPGAVLLLNEILAGKTGEIKSVNKKTTK